MEIKHRFVLNRQEYSMTISYNRNIETLLKIPENVGIYLLNKKIYEVNSKVNTKVFISFLKYWATAEIPQFNSDNIFEFYLLNKEFSLMDDCFSHSKYDDLLCISSLIYAQSKINTKDNQTNIKDISLAEEYIAIHLDLFLDKYAEDWLKISIISLYNIFNNNKRILNDQNKAYNFILRLSNRIDNYFILFSSLDMDKLNHEIVVDILHKENQYCGFIPKLNCLSLIEKNTSFEAKIKETEEEIIKLNDKYQQLLNDFEFIRKISLISNDEKIQKLLFLQQKLDINTVFHFEYENGGSEDSNLLHIAVEIGNEEIVKLLLSKSEIDVNIKHKITLCEDESNLYRIEEKTALCIAIEKGNKEIVQILLSNQNIDINLKSFETYIPFPFNTCAKNQKTPLFIAIEKGYTEIAFLLLYHHKININLESISYEVGDFFVPCYPSCNMKFSQLERELIIILIILCI